ncbi:MAG: hypothetical protein H3C50_04345 [Kiritimatiellae bacterium]|nr:hypothetical protein [Kiritimatiellia bacterium]MCO5068740.1 hypothetical protein [Kiritimatiellia bacterium]
MIRHVQRIGERTPPRRPSPPIRATSLGLAILLAGLLAGCATTKAPVLFSAAPRLTGEIVRVNDRARYVVAECSVLPSPGEEATVMRGDQFVGRIRFSSQMRPPFAVADLLEGEPLAGDRWRVDREGSGTLLEQKL